MARGRKPNPIPTIDWKCHVPVPIACKVDLLLLDPVTGNPRHGARSALVTELLIKWLEERGALTETSHGDQEAKGPGQDGRREEEVLTGD